MIASGMYKPRKANERYFITLFLAVSYRARGLVGGHDQHFGYLDMLGQGSGEVNHLGHIVARERTKPFIHVVGRSLIATETHHGEVRLHQSGLDVRHTYGSIHQIYTQTVRRGLSPPPCGHGTRSRRDKHSLRQWTPC